MSLALGLLVACSNAPVGAAPTSQTPPTHSDTPAALDAPGVASAIEGAFTHPFPTPARILEAYDSVISAGDTTCPGDGSGFFDLDGCTASTGWWYAGSAALGSNSHEAEGQLIEDTGLVLDLVAVSPEGREFDSGGHLSDQRRTASTALVQIAALDGTLYDSGSDGLDPAVSMLLDTEVHATDGAVTSVRLDGAITLMDVSVRFEDLIWQVGGCSGGAIHVRGPDQRWYTLGELDCDGCGDVTLSGEALGEACVDLAEPLEALGVELLGETR